jgi:hypothetical protein
MELPLPELDFWKTVSSKVINQTFLNNRSKNLELPEPELSARMYKYSVT